MEPDADGSDHLIARAMNLVEQVGEAQSGPGELAHRIVDGHSQPGSYRLIMDLANWRPLKWLDEPCPLVEWRGANQIHPDDEDTVRPRMRREFAEGSTSAVLRLPAKDGGWVALHVAITRMELEDGVHAGLATLRVPTDGELTDAGLAPAGETGG